jgi:hypothetical protein
VLAVAVGAPRRVYESALGAYSISFSSHLPVRISTRGPNIAPRLTRASSDKLLPAINSNYALFTSLYACARTLDYYRCSEESAALLYSWTTRTWLSLSDDHLPF